MAPALPGVILGSEGTLPDEMAILPTVEASELLAPPLSFLFSEPGASQLHGFSDGADVSWDSLAS